MSRNDLKEAIIASAKKRARSEIELEALMKQAENPCANGDDAESGGLSSKIERCKEQMALYEKEMDTLVKRYTNDADAKWMSTEIVMRIMRSILEVECRRMVAWLLSHYKEDGNGLQLLWDLYRKDNPNFLHGVSRNYGI